MTPRPAHRTPDPDAPAPRTQARSVGCLPGRRSPASAPQVTIVSGSVGAGHDGVARELAVRLSADGVNVTVLDHLAFLPSVAQFGLRNGYTASVSKVPALFEWIFQRLRRPQDGRRRQCQSCQRDENRRANSPCCRQRPTKKKSR